MDCQHVETLPLTPTKFVVETLVSTKECPTIDSVKQKLECLKDKVVSESDYLSLIKSRRILFCPNTEKWHMITTIEDNNSKSAFNALTTHFSNVNERVFMTSTLIAITDAALYDDLQAEADGCLRVLDKNFTDEEWRHYNIDVVTTLLSKIVH